MDTLAGLLDGPRARSAFLLRVVMRSPWAIRVADRAPLSLTAVLRGEAWVHHDGDPPTRLGPDVLAITSGPAPYTFAAPAGTAPQVLVRPGQLCTTLHGRDLRDELLQGVRTWGHDPGGAGDTELLVGTYEHVSELGARLLAALPPLVVVPRAAIDAPVVELLEAEVGRDAPGQQVVLDRLLDLLVVAALRAWCTGLDGAAPGWFRAGGDPVVGPALALLEQQPERAWTVATLAAEVGTSRATLARRFTDLVGEPPMTYLTERRIALAADLLLDPDTTVTAVADRVGYATPYALSAAFKRARGHSPTTHRRTHR